MLDTYAIQELEKNLRDVLSKNLMEYLCILNRNEELEQWLDMVGLGSFVQKENAFKPYKTGKIVVIGQSNVSADVLCLAAKKMGFDKSRFEFYLSYEELKSKDFRYLQYNQQYCLILVGPMPHCGKTMEGGYTSIITAMETADGYPPVIRLGNSNLSITKSSFQNNLKQALEQKLIA